MDNRATAFETSIDKSPVNYFSGIFLRNKPFSWDVAILKLEINRYWFEGFSNFHKTVMRCEPLEKSTAALATIATIGTLAAQYLLSMFHVQLQAAFIFTICKFLLFVCDGFCVFWLFLLGLISYFEIYSDPFRLLYKVVKSNWSYEEYRKNFDAIRAGFKSEIISSSNPEQRAKDIEDFANMGYEGYGEKLISFAQRVKWCGALPKYRKDICTLISDKDGERFAYYAIFPMSTDICKNGGKHYDGRDISQFEIGKSEICKTGKSNRLFIQALFIRTKYLENHAAVIFVLGSFFYKIASLLTENKVALENAIIFSEPISMADRRLFKKLGFRWYFRTSVQKQRIYELRLGEKRVSRSALQSKKIILEIMKEIKKGNK